MVVTIDVTRDQVQKCTVEADTPSDSAEVEVSIDSSMPTVVSSGDSRPESAAPHHETTESTTAESATTTASIQSSAPPVMKTYPHMNVHRVSDMNQLGELPWYTG